jgi:transposase-like protein
MDEQTQQLRIEARQLARGRAPRGIRYSVAFRHRTVALVREQVRRGVPLAQVVREIGLTTASIARWRQPRRRASCSSPRQGLRVEGLDAAGLIAVLRALA